MRVLNIGSLNIDYVYTVDHIILPGETEATGSRNTFLGGKGMNQSCALAKAGVEVYHGGMIGQDGTMFLDACKEYGVHDEFIKIYGGANQKLTVEYIDEVLSHFGSDDILLLQNEVNLLPYIVDKAYEKGMQIALNPSPFNEKLDAVDMKKISIFLLNEVEGNQVTGLTDPDEIIAEMLGRFPNAKIVLTLGKDGAVYADASQKHFQPIFKVKAVDTTAAGDTFTGYFLAGLADGLPMEEVLRMSAKASSIAVSREGAVPSIPYRAEVLEALQA